MFRMPIVPVLILLWIASWVSLPGNFAVHGIDNIDNQPHKLIARLTILIIVGGWLIFQRGRFQRILANSKIPILYVFYNIAILPLSANLFYSFFRLVEFVLIVFTAALIVFHSRNMKMLRKDIAAFFGVFTVAIGILLYLFILDPDIFGKNAGLDVQSGDYNYRFGGYILRVDLIAALAGASTIFWLLGAILEHWVKPVIAWSAFTVTTVALIFAQSRAALILTTVISCYFFFKSRGHVLFKLMFFLFAVCLLVFFSIDQIANFYLRGESSENISTMSGRTYIAASLLNINPWYAMVIGNGYLMNWPEGLFFPVPEFGGGMSSPHNGYLSVLLGSGLFGFVLVLIMNIQMWQWSNQIFQSGQNTKMMWIRPIQVFLSSITLFDYGVWGVTSPAMLIFFVIYFLTMRITLLLRNARVT